MSSFQTKFLFVFLSLFRHLFIFFLDFQFLWWRVKHWVIFKIFPTFFLNVHFLHLSVFWVLIYFYKCFLKTPNTKKKRREKFKNHPVLNTCPFFCYCSDTCLFSSGFSIFLITCQTLGDFLKFFQKKRHLWKQSTMHLLWGKPSFMSSFSN